jgi:hypothetical protein
MKKYTIDLSDIVALYDHYEVSEQDIGIAYIIKELWREDIITGYFTREYVLEHFPHFRISFDNLVIKGIITEVK